jgi:hypothetical protein
MNQGLQGHHKLNSSDSNRKWGLRTVRESFPSHSSSPSNASFGETRFRYLKMLAMSPVVALRMK